MLKSYAFQCKICVTDEGLVMDILLKQIRTEKGLSQEEMAKLIGVKTSRYGTWERGERMLNLEQAYNCAVVLGCTLNDLVGMKTNRSYADQRQTAINAHFETFNDSGRTELATIAERMSHDPSIRIEKDSTEHTQVRKALGA